MTPLSFFRSPATSCIAYLALLGLVIGTPRVEAADITWDGSDSQLWSGNTNWVGDVVPGNSSDRAIFSGNATDITNTTVDLSGNTQVEQIRFSTDQAAAYTIGILGTDTLTFTNQNAGSINVEMLAAVANDQIIAANIAVENPGANADISFVNRSTTNDLIINGDLTRGGSDAAGTIRFEFGELATLNSPGNIIINGDVSNSGSPNVINFLVGGNATVTMNGVVEQQATNQNDQRTIILDQSTLNVGAAGLLGKGQFDIREGTVNLTNTTTAQEFRNNLNMGSATQADNGDATLNIGAGVTAELYSTITYFASTDGNDNRAFINGPGTLQITSGNRGVTVNDNTTGTLADSSVAELVIASNITSDNGNRALSKNNGGTLLLSGNSIANGSITINNGILKLLQDNALNTTVRDVTVQQANSSNLAASGNNSTFDLNGADVQIDDLFLGALNTVFSGGNMTSIVENTNPSEGGILAMDDILYREGTRIRLDYDNELNDDVATNQLVVGNTSGARGFIIANSRSGTTGRFTLENVTGTFQDDELLIVQGTGNNSAIMANGTQQVVNNVNRGAIVSANILIGAGGGGDSAWTIDNGADITDGSGNSGDLLFSGDIYDDNNARDIIIRGEGTVVLGGNNTHSRTVIENQLTILSTGTAFGTGNISGVASVGNDGGTSAAAAEDGEVRVRLRNVASESGAGAEQYNGNVTLDINGQDIVFAENLVIGDSVTNIVADGNSTVGTIQIIDSKGTGTLILNGINGNNDDNNITYSNGGGDQKMATISADIRFDGSSSSITVNDGADDVDLLITGQISNDLAGGRTVSKGGTGVLRLANANNAFDGLNINVGTVEIFEDGNLGDNDVQLGNNTTFGTLSYIGTGGVIDNQFRVGQNNAGAGRIGAGSILNNGMGNLTLSNAAFNQARTAGENRVVTFGGTSTGTNTVTGAIIDNNGGNVGVAVTGNGTWVFNGANTYSGNTDVSSARADFTGASTGTGDFNVAANSNLGGEGSIGGNLTFGGNNTLFINPATPGNFTTSGSLAVTTGNVTVDFNGGSGAGEIAVLTFGSYANSGNVSTDFVAAAGTITSARGGGSLTSSISGNTVVFDLGFADLVWNGNSTNVGAQTHWEDNTTTGGNLTNWDGSDGIFFNGDSVTFDGTADGTTVLLTSNVEPTSITFIDHVSAFNVSANTTETINIGAGGLNFFGNTTVADDIVDAELIGSGTITKGQTVAGTNDVGDVRLGGNNTNFTGVTIINQGNLRLTDLNAIGNDTTNTVTLNDFGDDPRLYFEDEGTFVNDVIATNQGGTKAIYFDNGGNNTVAAANMTGTITNFETSSSLVFSVEGRYENGYGGTNTALRGTHVLGVDGNITSASATADGPVVKADLGTAVFTNANNNYTGRTDINGGTLRVASIGNIGEASHLGASRDVHTFDIRLGQNNNEGVLVYTGAGDESTDRQVQIGQRNQTGNNNTGGGRIVNNGGNITFTATTFNIPEASTAADVGQRNLTLSGTSTGTGTIEGVIQDNTPTDAFVDETVSVVVDADGTWALNGANTYTGTTTVESGTLLLNGSTSASSIVTVNGGTLGGTGSIGGNIIIGAAGSHTAATATTAGLQTASADLDYNADATLVWNLMDENATDGSGFFDQFNVGGELDFNSNNTNIQIVTGTDVDFGDAFWNAGSQSWQVWDLNTLGGTLAGFDAMNFTFLAVDHNGSGTAPVGRFSVFEVNDGSLDGNGVYIGFTGPIPEPSTYALFGLGLAGFGWFARRRRKQASDAVDSEK